ncbi:MAG: helix-turn-helix transcriptional regulator [Candidatus Sumerlaeota bacterium]|nr:helix-turn-helix transcriptional regulator [Candidatus Sumerlaeota bacterium]
MAKLIAPRLFQHRKRQKLTQDEFGRQYGVSGPGIFKFEKGFITPTLKVWMKMSADMGIPRKTAVLMHIHDKLPEEHREVAGIAAMIEGAGDSTLGKDNFKKHRKKAELQEAVANHQWLPQGLRDFAADVEQWSLYSPTGEEVNILRDIFAPLGDGKARDFCDGLRLVREFRGSGA